MKPYTHKIAFVVPTKDRPADLRRLLESVERQGRLPDQLIVVDGSEAAVEHICQSFPRLLIDYVRYYPPSLAHQRNAGMAKLRPDITLAGYLDDDLVFEPGAMDAMYEYWETAPEALGGVRFNIIDEPKPRLVWLKRMFLLDHPRRGAILRSGFQTSISATDKDFEVDWLSGGATVWRRRVVEEFRYDEWFLGYGYLEDVDYSYRVRSKYRLRVTSAAKVRHLSHPWNRDRMVHLGKWEAINRMYFTRKHSHLSVALCYWALFGHMLLNVVRGLWTQDAAHLLRARGNATGLWTLVRGRTERLGGHIK